MSTVEHRRRDSGFERLTTETKQAFKTTEFWVLVVVAVGILVASAVIGEGDSGNENKDTFDAFRAWTLVTVLAAAYMIGRGLAKAGSRDPYWADLSERPTRKL